MDTSAAFECIDTLLYVGTALSLIKSYLTDKLLVIQSDNNAKTMHIVRIGAALFSFYTRKIS